MTLGDLILSITTKKGQGSFCCESICIHLRAHFPKESLKLTIGHSNYLLCTLSPPLNQSFPSTTPQVTHLKRNTKGTLLHTRSILSLLSRTIFTHIHPFLSSNTEYPYKKMVSPDYFMPIVSLFNNINYTHTQTHTNRSFSSMSNTYLMKT